MTVLLAAFVRVFAVIVVAVLIATAAHAQRAKPNSINIQYVPPKSADHQQVYDLLRQQKTLEKLRELLSPLRLPRRLLLKTQGCEGISNAWYDGESVTVCYEYLDDLWKNVPEQTTLGGVAPVDALIGPVADVFLHEAGHAVFDILKIPLFGREEDAADQFSIYIMLKFPKDEARRLILGNAFQYKGDLKSPHVTMSLKKFADAHGTPSQRFFNVLCTAYGADPELFKDLVSSGALPQDRAEGCEDEYQQVAYAFGRLIRPHVDQRLARKLHRSWLPDVSTKPKRKQ